MEITESKTDPLEGIITGLQKKEISSLSTLFEAFNPIVYDYFLRIVKEPKKAEQLLMEVFINAWFGAQELGEKQTDIQQWLLGIVAQVASDRLKIEKESVLLHVIREQAGDQELHLEERERLRETILKFREQARH